MRRLALFARAPVEGFVKSRLSPALPPRLATALYAGMLADAFGAVAGARADERLVYWAGPPGDTPFDVHARTQPEGDLGVRLAAAFDDLIFASGDHALVLGSDIPGLDAAHIDAAFAALDRHDVVLGGARDGGYWCIGLTWSAPELFHDIPWSTPEVLERTLARASVANRRVAFAQPLDDLDTPADLAFLVGALAAGRRACGPNTLAALSSAGIVPEWIAARASRAEEAPSRSSA